MNRRTVVIFEDIGARREELKAPFHKAFGNTAKVEFFEPGTITAKSKGPKIYEEQIVNHLRKLEVKIDEIALMVTDRDLSRYDRWGGLSEAVISNLGNMLAVPVCLYAREDNNKKQKIAKITKWSDFKIVLDIGRGPAAFARECKIIFEGFEAIRNEFNNIIKSHTRPKSPAEIMAKILVKPELQDRIALYGAGDQHMVEDILPYTDNKKTIEKRIPRLLGYWLWDSILRYPGIFVYGNAAASYLNIHPDDFRKKAIQDLFKKALYKGPFSEVQDYWWRCELDNILSKEACTDGYDLAKKRGKTVSQCKCSVDNKLKAGYYCMITQEPVSNKYSKSNISWFPTGADLARISKPEYDKLAPWIGLY